MKNRLTCLLIVVLGLCLVSACAETDYRAYLETNAAPPAAQSITLDASEADISNMPGAYVLDDGSLYTTQSGYIELEFEAPQTAMYAMRVTYFPGVGTGGDMRRSIKINGEAPYSELDDVVFSRMWNNKSDEYKTVKGNQPFPSQVETPEWKTVYITDAEGYVDGALTVILNEGVNTLRITSEREGMIISGIEFTPPPALISYQEYLSLNQHAPKYAGEPVKIQAEDAALKSGPSFYPLNDRTSPLTEPYHYSNIVLNIIGGSAWNDPGEWIAWDVYAPEAGLYKLAFRFKQNDLRGLYATRKLTINGELPFEEAADLRFYHSDSWQFGALGEYNVDGDAVSEYWFYLDEGVNRVALEVSLGELGAILTDLNTVTNDLNALYRRITAITGSSPDAYRDYQLFTRLPALAEQLRELRARVNEICERLTALTGSNSERTAGMTRLLNIMDEMVKNENQVVKRLSSYKECITSMGKAVLDLANQPLKLDYLIIYGEQAPKVKAEGNVFENAWHALRAFVGSFTNDYNVSESANVQAEKQLDVWLSTGRDQFDVIRRLINESFETEYGIKINLKLISADVVLPATATGNGPDLTIQITNSAPVNFAFRDAALDLTEFEDFEEVAGWFHPAAFTSFEYEGGVYGLPDQMSFPVMFYRTDIFEQLGLNPPATWTELIELIPILEKDNMEIYLDTNPVGSLGAALSMGNSRAINTVFLSLLYQQGGDIYAPGGMRTLLDTAEANNAFKTWTKFYTQHNFPQDIDFTTRFRIGEVPLGIIDLSYYNTLTVSAPEIRGVWAVAPVPGMLKEDGTIAHDTPAVTSAAMIIKNMAEARGTKDEAWEFIKWWTRADTQTAYAREMEAVLGAAGKYLVANLTSFEAADWPGNMHDVLNGILDELHGIPQVPGGYITGRYLYNAFITVITDYENAADVLFEFNEQINEEIDKKREEFGLPLASDASGTQTNEIDATP